MVLTGGASGEILETPLEHYGEELQGVTLLLQELEGVTGSYTAATGGVRYNRGQKIESDFNGSVLHLAFVK